MPFGIIGRTGPGMRQAVGFGNRSTEMGTFGGEFGARYCNQWGLTFATTRPSSQITLGRLVILVGDFCQWLLSEVSRVSRWTPDFERIGNEDFRVIQDLPEMHSECLLPGWMLSLTTQVYNLHVETIVHCSARCAVRKIR